MLVPRVPAFRVASVLAGPFLLLPLLAQTARPPARLEPAALRVEYLVNPLAIQEARPRLSWEFVETDARGARQTAYRILVASRPDLLAAGRGDLWDSGKVASDESIQVAYSGRPLESRQPCYWRVQVWDERDRASAWSAPAQWNVGLLDPSDWTARWIGDAAPSVEDVSATYLRRAFTLPARPTRAIAYVSALGLYDLRINGRRIGDHRLAPEWTDYGSRVQYQAYDVTPFLRSGENVAAAIVSDGWYAGGISHATVLRSKPRNMYGVRPAMLVQIEAAVHGRTTRIVSDETWRASRNGPVRAAVSGDARGVGERPFR